MSNINNLKKYHFIYKTTNLLNGKYYVGMHSTSNLKDGYLGSGKKLRYSIKKYGESNFKLEILEFFDTREKLVEREKELINEDLLQDPMCMNLKIGGTGGFTGRNGEHLGGDKFKGAQKYWNIPENKQRKIESSREAGKKRFAAGELDYFRCDWKGRKHKEESKKKIGLANSKTQKGERNSQYSSFWITNGVENRKVKKGGVVPENWYRGRVF